MASKINITRREQVDKTADVERNEEGELVAIGKIVFTDNEAGWVGRSRKIGTPFEDDPMMLLHKISMRRMDAGMVEVTEYYKLPRHSSSTFGGEETEYDMEYSCSEQPLLTHPLFKGLEEDEQDALMALASGASKKETLGEDGKKIEDIIKSNKGKKAMEKIRKGIISFLCPSGVFSVTSTVGSASLAGVGKKTGAPSGAPALPSGYNWIYDGIRGRKTGNGNWRVTKSYRCSGDGGWDTDLY